MHRIGAGSANWGFFPPGVVASGLGEARAFVAARELAARNHDGPAQGKFQLSPRVGQPSPLITGLLILVFR
jgi:hypothetical protein